MSLYHLYCLCDFASIFSKNMSSFPTIPQINKDSNEAVIVAFLNYYAENMNFPLSLYRSDLHEKGTILNGKLDEKSEQDIENVRKAIAKFVNDDYLNLINNKYRNHTGLTSEITYTKKSIKRILKNFIDEYLTYTPPNTQ